MFAKRLGIIFLVIAILLLVILFFYIKEERFISRFKSGLERFLSEATGTEITIGYIGGNIFKKVILYDLGAKLKDFTINFDKAQLEYSLWDVLWRKKSIAKNSSNLILLEGGSLKFKDNPVISKQINGKISLLPDKIVIEDLEIKLFTSFDNQIKGEIIKQKENHWLDLFLTVEPFFDDKRLLFSKAYLNIKGSVNNPSFNGGINRTAGSEILLDGNFVLSEEILRFSSRLDFEASEPERAKIILAKAEIDLKKSSFRLSLTPAQGNIIINGDYLKWPLLVADITNDHIKICGLDFSNLVHLAAELVFKRGDFSHIVLELYTESTILNYYPFDEFEASFWIDQDLLRLICLKVGDTISASGVLSLKPPPRLFLKLTLADFDINRLWFVSKEQESPIASGRLSGQAVIEGPVDELRTKASLGIEYGHLGTVDYQNMILNMEGVGPILTVHDSRLIREDSFMTLEGAVDIRRLGKERFLEGLKISTDPHTIVWDGWDISKTAEQNELKLSKGLNRGVKVGFKRQMDDETTYQAVKPQDEFGLEYKMPDEEGLLELRTKEKEEFFGLKKRYKF